ncbi:unnamed protein product [Linum tenue]|uniref:Tesmin/TSO1-like CXC domain-containing protein n=1 Tax=Linum tenue TaxID=586396 RepID=A0AAV0K5K5_9ROSI|nr:unnamed protein product [Linum tenue]
MKRANRRTKRTGVTDSPSPSKCGDSEKPPPPPQQNHERRIHDLEKENDALKREVEELRLKLGNDSPASDGKIQKLYEGALEKLRILDEQAMDLKKKLNAQSQFSTQKQKTAGRQPDDVIQRLKAQKVQLLCKIKLDSVQFRLSKASLEKEVLQLKKDQRKNEYEIRKLLALTSRQKLVLQRKQEEASAATRKLNEFLESRKASSQRSSGSQKDGSPGSQAFEIELKVAERVEDIRSDFERQMEEMAEEVKKYEEEVEMLRQENFSFMLQDKENDCIARDSELRDLKEEVFKLSTMVNQMPLVRAGPVHLTKPQDASRSVLFEMPTVDSETSDNVPTMVKSAQGECCSCSKNSLCKTNKCQCRAAKGSCGQRCRCSTAKCTNGKGLAKKDSSLLSVIAQDLLHSSGSETTSDATSPNQATKRQPFSEIGNVEGTSKSEEETKIQKPSTHLEVEQSTDNQEALKPIAEKTAAAPPDIFKKLTRAMRSAVVGK